MQHILVKAMIINHNNKWKQKDTIFKDVMDNRIWQCMDTLILLKEPFLSPQGYLTHDHDYLDQVGQIGSFS